ncbi:MAG: response regulator transcription factor [Dehalococcoidales bacterium]|jgi:DNA-binding NarL/FixJ family response regulator|nr:response regulator transcription factor [Dehalococcoidales bacterium]MDD3994613.1 response regulator transcription factor [Dehalococcoidales bacterium]NLT28001.1 response regulator transcription factor [Dehalococcoidales bacterium]
MKVLITDDHPIVRQGLKQLLKETFEAIVVDEAGNGTEALDKIKAEKYDIVLLDIAMPGMNGLEVLKEIQKFNKTLPVLIISIYPEDQYALRCLKAGASGYLTKDTASDELTLAVERILSGKKYVSPNLADKLARHLNQGTPKLPHELLSDREDQVMRYIASGKTAAEIAADLNLSVKTINTYRNRILKKMQIKNSAELIRYAVQNQLLN